VKSLTIKNMMIPLSKCAAVHEDANLHEAVLALYEAQRERKKSSYKLKEILVVDRNEQVIGMINPLDLIFGIEDNYKNVGDLRHALHTGFTPEFIKMMIERYNLWQESLSDVCNKAARHTVAALMDKPTPGEYIEEEASFVEAINRLILGHYPYLLVTRGDEVAGILRTDDVFGLLCEEIKACEIG
jgi:hypothetical protein